MRFLEIVRCLPAADQKVIGDMMVLFDGIDRQTEKFAGQTGLQCPAKAQSRCGGDKNGCGACFENPDVETTVAEVLPLAVHLWSKGSALGKLEDIRSKSFKGVCVFYDPLLQIQGRCRIYPFRPGLCRLFGFAARKNKYGQRKLITCKIIKDSQPLACKRTGEELLKGTWDPPLLTTHALAVAKIDPLHGQKLLPINQAIRLGVEKIGYGLELCKLSC